MSNNRKPKDKSTIDFKNLSITSDLTELNKANKMSETNNNQHNNDSDNEFYDACDSLGHKLQTLDTTQTTEYYEDNEDSQTGYDSSDNSDFESQKNDIFKKFDERVKLESVEKDQEEKFVPLHERLNKEQQADKTDETNEEQVDENEIINDQYYINEIDLEKEQSSMTEPEKEEKLKEAQELKQSGNNLFKEEKYPEALEAYTQALRCCPLDSKKERSIFHSNRSICFLKMKENLKCIRECSKSIELDPTYIKPLLRRAECLQIEDKLDESLNDYKKLNELEPKYQYRQKCSELEELIKDRNEKLKTEMMGKLKDLGNMVLKPFGLSTNNFQFVQDPSTGSYSVNFKQN